MIAPTLLLANVADWFSSAEYVLSLPIMLLTLFAAGILLIDSITPSELKWMNSITALTGLSFSAAGVMRIQFIQAAFESSGHHLEWAFRHSVLADHLSIYFYYLFLMVGEVTILGSTRDVEIAGECRGKFYALTLLAVAGMMCMAAGFDIVIIFAGLELMSLSTYIVLRVLGKDVRLREASRKVCLRGVISSAIFAFGLFLLYGLTGSTNLQLIAQGLKNAPGNHVIPASHALVILALGFTVIGLFFKIAVMPLHYWMLEACDVAPPSIAGFIVLSFQVAGLAVVLRVLLWGLYSLRSDYVPMLMFVAAFSIVGANVTALTQTSLPRLLAYSSIAHMGFMILGLISLVSVQYPAPAFFEGFKGILMYLLTYALMTLGAFWVVANLSYRDGVRNRSRDGDGMDCLVGLYYHDPFTAVFMTIFLLSLAGVPPIAGFYGKYFIVRSLFGSGHYSLATLAIACSFTALYYYGRLAQLMFMRDERVRPDSAGISVRVALAVLALLAVAAGIYPRPLIQAIEWSLRLT